jgi:hypothetical protein
LPSQQSLLTTTTAFFVLDALSTTVQLYISIFVILEIA